MISWNYPLNAERLEAEKGKYTFTKALSAMYINMFMRSLKCSLSLKQMIAFACESFFCQG